MKVTFSEYFKDAAMWNKTRDFTVDMKDPYPILSALGFKETNHGTYWRQTAYNEAEGAVIN